MNINEAMMKVSEKSKVSAVARIVGILLKQ